MSTAVPDPREPKPCPRCGETCTHDGWGHVHPNGIGIGSCTVPDPRFRDQLAGAATAVGDMAEDWWCPKREGVRRTECRYCIAEFAIDAALPLVEARVQAAAKQRVAEVGEAVYRFGRALAQVNPDALTCDAARLNRIALDAHTDLARALWGPGATALASPGPAPRAEEGQR